jgi:hypothetical protein
MEESELGTKSYQYHRQSELIPTSIHKERVFAWKAEKMGSDWVGSQLLTIETIPYHKVKEDSYAICEYIGDWIRCIVTSDRITWTTEQLEAELQTLHSWLTVTAPSTKLDRQPRKDELRNDEPCMIRFSPSSAKLNAFHVESSRNHHKMHYTIPHRSYYHRSPSTHNG